MSLGYYNKFTISTKRFELNRGFVPKEEQKDNWKFRVNKKEIVYQKHKFKDALDKVKEIAETDDYFFIELLP